MKKTLPLIVVISSCLLSLVSLGLAVATTRSSRSKKIVYLDTNKLLDSYQAMASARHEYQREKQEWAQNLRTLADEAQQAAQHSQSVPKNAGIQQEAHLKQQQFLNYRQAVLRQDPEEMQRLTQPVVRAANHFIALYSQAHNYDMVLSSAGQGDVIYATPALDVTAQVLAELNQHLADSLSHTGEHTSK